jgi:hypothetical protein
MSTLNVGAMAARLGLDPSDFLDKMKGVEGFASGSGQRIAAAMKQSSREGAESLRLIDEALGIHLSRPVTRIISQEFPALASGLQSILGAGVIGAVGVGLFEFGEKAAAAMEKAKKAQEEYRASQEKLKTTFDEMMAGYEKAAAKSQLSGVKAKLFDIDSESVEKGKRQLEEISKAVEDNAKKALAASTLWNRVGAAIQEAWDNLTSSSGTLAIEKTNEQFAEFRKKLDAIKTANEADPTSGLALRLIAVQQEAWKAAAAMEALQNTQLSRTVPLAEAYAERDARQKSIPAQQAYIDSLQKELDVLKALGVENKRQRDQAIGEDWKAQTDKASAAIEALGREVDSVFAKISTIQNPFTKQIAEAEGMREKMHNALAALDTTVANDPQWDAAVKKYQAGIDVLNRKIAELRKSDEEWRAEQALPAPSSIAPGPALPSMSAAASTMPTLSLAPVRGDLSELQKVQTDANAAWAEAGKILDSLESPTEKYSTQLQVLRTLLDQGRISTTQYQEAVAQLGTKLEEAEIHVNALDKKIEQLLAHSTSATDGMKAFAFQVEKLGGENGKFTFDVLNQALNNFEENTVKMLEGTRVNWRKYFEDLAAMGLKFMETKAIGGALGLITGEPKNQNGQQGGASVGGGIFSQFAHTALPSAVPGAATSTASMSAAGATLSQAGTQLLAAAAALRTAASSMSMGSGAGTGGDSDLGPLAGFAGFFAEGGDVAPGQDFIAGEQGPELIRAGTAGANVTPSSKTGGGDSHYYDLRGAVVTDDLMRRAEAAAAIKQSERRMMSALPTMQREIGLRSRGGR